ncbi:MAG TPA: KH domain-containing protein [Candidatus Saccharimonadales bacterium]|nr:KH domain-containing protein [Candidatus Saccharimonadales bacterium]
MATSIDQQFVEFIVKSLVNNPDAVVIDRRIDEKGVLLELTVDAEDLGRVIGKRGATAQSLRTLLRALGTKNEARYNLKIVDVDRPESERGSRPAPSTDGGDDSYSDDTSAGTDTGSTSSAAQDDDDITALADDDAPAAEKRESDTVARTRKELADLDDLDI